MAFINPLEPDILLWTGEEWEDVSADVRLSDADSGGGLTIARGERNETTHADPATCSMVFNNRAGKYSSRNPLSPNYGKIGRNTPVRVRLYVGDDPGTAVALPGPEQPWNTFGGQVLTSHHSSMGTTDLDVRFEFLHHNNWLEPASFMLGGRWNIDLADGRSWYVYVPVGGHPELVWTPDGTYASRLARRATAPPTPDPSGHVALRVTLDVDNGSGGHTVTFYTGESLDGPWEQLGDQIVTSGTTTVYAPPSAALEFGWLAGISTLPFNGLMLGFKQMASIGGAAVVDANYRDWPIGNPAPAAKWAGPSELYTDPTGHTWNLQWGSFLVDLGARFTGEVASWPNEWDVTEQDKWASVEAADVLRRLQQNSPPAQSPLLRTLSSYDPAGYLALEEGSDATTPSSVVPGLPTTARDVTFGQETGLLAGAKSAVRLDTANAYISSAVQPMSGQTLWAFQVLMKYAATWSGPDNRYARIYMAGGSVYRWDLERSGGGFRVRAVDADDNVLSEHTQSEIDTRATNWIGSYLQMEQVGSNIVWGWLGIQLPDVGYLLGAGVAAHSFAGTLGRPTRIEILGSTEAIGALFSHMVIAPTALPFPEFGYINVMSGYAGEVAAHRVRRLCRENNIPLMVYGPSRVGTLMGAQPIAPLVELLRECAATDLAVFQGARGFLGLEYRTRQSLANRSALPISYADRLFSPPFKPLDDDDGIVNDVTVSREGGGSERAVKEDGPMSVQPPPLGVGRYPSQPSINPATDRQLRGEAYFRLHLGTSPEARWKTLKFDFTSRPWQRKPSLQAEVLQLDAGHQVALVDLPPGVPPGPTRAQIRGYTETIDAFEWTVTLNARPGSAWQFFTIGHPVWGRLDTGGSELALSAGTNDTQLLVQTDNGKRTWITSTSRPQDFPFAAQLGGEIVKVTGIGEPVLNQNWGFETTASPWASDLSGTVTRSTAQSRFGRASLLLTPDGVSAVAAAISEQVTGIVAGEQYRAGAWVRCAVGRTINLHHLWYNSGGGFISQSSNSVVVVANRWTPLYATVEAPAGAARLAIRFTMGSTPSAATLLYIDQAIIARPDPGSSPQTFRVERGLNGVIKAHPAGSRVRIAAMGV